MVALRGGAVSFERGTPVHARESDIERAEERERESERERERERERGRKREREREREREPVRHTPHAVTHNSHGFSTAASERRGNNLNGLRDVYLKAKARI